MRCPDCDEPMTPAWPSTIGEDFDVVERRMQEEKPTRYLCIHCEKSVDTKAQYDAEREGVE